MFRNLGKCSRPLKQVKGQFEEHSGSVRFYADTHDLDCWEILDLFKDVFWQFIILGHVGFVWNVGKVWKRLICWKQVNILSRIPGNVGIAGLFGNCRIVCTLGQF